MRSYRKLSILAGCVLVILLVLAVLSAPVAAQEDAPVEAVQYEEPPQQQYQEPPQEQYQEPPQQQYEEPPQQQYEQPPQEQYQEPPQEQYQEPPQEQYQEPPQEQYQEQYQEPPQEQYQEPPQQQYEEPPQQQYQEPPQEQYQEVQQPSAVLDAHALRAAARRLPEGCTEATRQYLHRIHQGRETVAKAYADARAELTEARKSNKENEPRAEILLAQATEQLNAYDTETYSMYGANLPRTCISEVQDYVETLPSLADKSQFAGTYIHFYRLVDAHARTLYKTAKGVGLYVADTYGSMLKSVRAFADTYYEKANAYYYKAHPENPAEPVPPMEVALNTAIGMAYSVVPAIVMGGIGIIILALSPVLTVGVVLPDFLYQVWMRMFFWYYTYGLTVPAGLLQSLGEYKALLMSQNWPVLGSRAAEAFFSAILEPDREYYNGLLMMFIILSVAFTALVAVGWWAQCFVCCGSCRGSCKGKKASAGKKDSKKESSKPAGAAKKKN